MLRELVFLEYHPDFASYLYSCKILQPYVAATVRMHSDTVLSSTGGPVMKTVIKIIVNKKWWFFINNFPFGFGRRLQVNLLLSFDLYVKSAVRVLFVVPHSWLIGESLVHQ